MLHGKALWSCPLLHYVELVAYLRWRRLLLSLQVDRKLISCNISVIFIAFCCQDRLDSLPVNWRDIRYSNRKRVICHVSVGRRCIPILYKLAANLEISW